MMKVDWPTLGGQLGLGFVLGFAIGYAAKKALKVALVVTGVLALVAVALDRAGFVTVHWHQIEAVYNSHLPREDLQVTVRSWAETLSGMIPVTGGFVVGFLFGLRKG